MKLVWMNGEFLPPDEARVSVLDRGFLFADGVYEVTPFYRGRPFRMEAHLARLERGLCALGIVLDVPSLEEVKHELVVRSGLAEAEVATVYLQVTRGVAPRSHAFPDPPVPPTVVAWAGPFVRPDEQTWAAGFDAVSVPDRRWSRADIKSIQLLPNVLAQEEARKAGVKDALLVRDGLALEGAHNNVFAVFEPDPPGGHPGGRAGDRPGDRGPDGPGAAPAPGRGEGGGHRTLLHRDHHRGAPHGPSGRPPRG
ncbi:MAG: hypothetical protein EA352_04025 [Gemmatimonadales bacterium]|nr:MAG: hypothetical protein EA352_04025 [Gemmatimonadales bacterium]